MRLEDELKAYARSIGLDAVGIAAAGPFAPERDVLLDRQARGLRTTFEEPDVELRTDPQRLLPGARSIVAVGVSYLSRAHVPGARDGESGADGPRGFLSRYCRGPDYHVYLRERLRLLAAWLAARVPGARTYAFADTEPPIDRAVAERAGLGFYGRSGLLISPVYGTWLFLGGLLTDVQLEPDPPWHGTCGNCTRCVDACPTGAIIEDGVVDPRRCLSYVTQMKGSLPEDLREPLGHMIFGCDVCQDVCPYNRRPSVRAGDHPELSALPQVGGDDGPLLAELIRLSPATFRSTYARTAAGWRGKTVLQRNAAVALGNSRDPRAVPLLAEALGNPSPVVRAHAAWALGRLAAALPDLAPQVREILEQALATETEPAVRQALSKAANDAKTPAGAAGETPVRPGGPG